MAQGEFQWDGRDPIRVGAQRFFEYELKVLMSNALSISIHEAFVRCMRGGSYKRKEATGVAPMQCESSSLSGGISNDRSRSKILFLSLVL